MQDVKDYPSKNFVNFFISIEIFSKFAVEKETKGSERACLASRALMDSASEISPVGDVILWTG